MKHFAGIDIGSLFSKALVLDENNKINATISITIA